MDIYYAFAFLIDFCVSIAASKPVVVWGEGEGEVSSSAHELEGFGLLYELSGLDKKVFPGRNGILKHWIHKLIVSTMQVIDQIAATQLQKSRTDAPEYRT